MKLPFLLIAVLILAGCSDHFPSCEKIIPDKNGIIHHPIYGNYPEKITSEEMEKQGAWHPCQQVSFTFSIPEDTQKILRGEK